MVLGHTKCGEVKGACDYLEMGSLTALLSKIQPTVSAEKTITNNRTSSNEVFVGKVTANNVQRTVHTNIERSPILKELIGSGQCGIIGGNYDISTAEVIFYQDTKIGLLNDSSDYKFIGFDERND